MDYGELRTKAAFDGADRIAMERRAELDRQTANMFGTIPSPQLAEMLDDLAARVFQEGHSNHYLLQEAACRLRDY